MALTLIRRYIRKVPNELLASAKLYDWKNYNRFLFSLYKECSIIGIGAFNDYKIARKFYNMSSDQYTTIESIKRVWNLYPYLSQVLIDNKIIKGIEHGK